MTEPSKRKLRRIVGTLFAIYAFATAALIWAEPHLVYQPYSGPTEPAKAGLAHYTRHTLKADGMPTITYWKSIAPENASIMLYFHGNGGGLHLHTKALAYFAQHGLHVIAMEYPGYPGAAGKPEESLIIRQAQVLYDATRAKTGKKPIIWGFSLGTGIATQLAASRESAALILEAPFTATVDRAAELFPLAPVRYIMHNRFRSRDYIGNIHAPLFIMHGGADRIIPIAHGRALFTMASEPKNFKEYKDFGHLNLIDSGAYDDALSWIRATQK